MKENEDAEWQEERGDTFGVQGDLTRHSGGTYEFEWK
jgi:hypothetical protein